MKRDEVLEYLKRQGIKSIDEASTPSPAHLSKIIVVNFTTTYELLALGRLRWSV